METVKNKFIYPSTQLVSLLHPKVLKVYMYLLGFQNLKSYKAYTNQISKNTKLTEKEVEISIQTLVDNNLIQINNGFEVEFNREEPFKYFGLKLEEVQEMELLPVSKEITWNKTPKPLPFDDMTEEQLRSLILRLQVSLKEKELVKKMVKTSTDDLPF